MKLVTFLGSLWKVLCITQLAADSLFCISLCQGKAVPLQAWSGPEGSRKLRFPDYMTTG
jgi:hypothetical protein